jgi:hypothetical protein
MNLLRRRADRERERHGSTVSVKVITYAPTAFAHCQHCEITFDQVGLGERIRREAAASALPEALATDYARVSDWIRELVERHGRGVNVEVIDAASVQGAIASVRYRISHYPAVVVDGRPVGSDLSAAEPVIESELARLRPPVAPTTDAAFGGTTGSGLA